MRITTVSLKVGFGVLAASILTTMAIGTGSAASAAELPRDNAGSATHISVDRHHGPSRNHRTHRVPAPAPAPAPAAAAPAAEAGIGSESPAAQVLAQINKVRATAGVAPLTMNAQLVASGHQHNLTMAGGCGLSHQCSGEANAGARISAQGLKWNSWAENIGYGGPVADTDAAKASMATRITQNMINEVAPNDGHRRNILNRSLTKIGIDIYRDSYGTVWMTQDFAA